jgi:hypothetical protein
MWNKGEKEIKVRKGQRKERNGLRYEDMKEVIPR